MGRKYRKKRAKEQYSALEFENDEISLDIINSSGWEILALSEPLIVSNHMHACTGIITILCSDFYRLVKVK